MSSDSAYDGTRRTVLKTATAAAIGGVTGKSATAATSPDDTNPDRQQPQKYSTPEEVNRAIEQERQYFEKLRRTELIQSTVEELKVTVISEPSEDDPEGQLITETPTSEGLTPTIRIIRNTDKGVINTLLYPDSELEPHSTLNYHDSSKIKHIKPNSEDRDGLAIESDSLDTPDSPSADGAVTTQIGCQNCPEDDPCCRCKRVCVDNCHCSCTGIFEYRCKCCKHLDPRCWGDCY